MYVYQTTNLINGKKYIGVCVSKNKDKARRYLGSGILLKQAIKKYGKESFKREILKTFDTESEARNYEKYLIETLGAIESDDYYNLVPGGYGGGVKKHPVSEETKQKISKGRKGIKLSHEHILSMSKAVLQYDLNGFFMCEYYSKAEACKQTGLLLTITKNVQYTINGEYIFMYKNGDIHRKIPSADDIRAVYNKHTSKVNSKLTYEQVEQLIKDKENGTTLRSLANQYGIGISSISELLSGKTYRWYWDKKNKEL